MDKKHDGAENQEQPLKDHSSTASTSPEWPPAPAPARSSPGHPEAQEIPGIGVTSFVAAPPPPGPGEEFGPDQLEHYVRSAIHQDRSPGNVLIVCHPARSYKVPDGLFSALREAGFVLHLVDTEADRLVSVKKIRDALGRLFLQKRPLDVIVISGDGTLDHHVMPAAFWAFYPDLVEYRPGTVDCSAVTSEDLDSIPVGYREAFFASPLDTSKLEPDDDTIETIWLLRSSLETLVKKQRPVSRILRKSRRGAADTLLRVAMLSTLFPHKVTLRPHDFDLGALASASHESTFRGLYPFIRSLCCYPAGTAADNALFAGIPGWVYARLAGLLRRVPFSRPVRDAIQKRTIRNFLACFQNDGVVVPARVSFVAIDGAWRRISSHAVGGPAAGQFFAPDLKSKTRGLLGYLSRIPAVIIKEGLLSSTIVRVISRYATGATKSFTESQLAEGLYTNRTLIAGVGSIPTTGPTSFAGQSSLLVIPPIIYRDEAGNWLLNLRTLGAFSEAIVKGVLARTLHLLGLGVGTLAGGGKFSQLLPEQQVAIKEGEEIQILYMDMKRRPRAVPIQISGDPFQAFKLEIRVSWGPVPLLGRDHSLLLASTRRTLANLRLQQSYRLMAAYIGGTHYFRYHVGRQWTRQFIQTTGLVPPAHHLPISLTRAQAQLIDTWKRLGTGEFVDTTESGLKFTRHGRYAHNNDQSAHQVVLREPSRTLLVRQVRSSPVNGDDRTTVYETRTLYRAVGASYIIFQSQTTMWQDGMEPRILVEEHFFRNAEAFQRAALSFFPVVPRYPLEPVLL